MAASALDNPLLLSILGILLESPAHLYAINQQLQTRTAEWGFRFTRGSVNNLLSTLLDRQLIYVIGEEKAGNRPPRTVYALTEAGITELRTRIEQQLADASGNSHHFTQAVAYLGLLEFQQAVSLLLARQFALSERVIQISNAYQQALRQNVPELHILEADFIRSQLEAEIRWIEQCIHRLQNGTLAWPRPQEKP